METSTYLPYVVRLRRWRLYVLATVLPLQVVAVAVGNDARARLAASTESVPDVTDSLISAGQIAVPVMLGWAAALVFTALRNPPRVDAGGLWMWLPMTPEQVFVPWEQVRAVHTVRGGLRVYVHAPEAFALGDRARARRIGRLMRRTGGAFVSMAMDASPDRLRALDAAIRTFSQGRHELRYH